MKIKQLIEKLQKLDQERIVVLASDPEGNRFREIDSVHEYMYNKGEIGEEKLTPLLIKQGYSEEDVMANGRKAVVLFPR